MNDLPNDSFLSFENQGYSDCLVSLDNARFFRCKFSNVNFVYSGGPVLIEKCKFEGHSRLTVQGAAKYALEFFYFVRDNSIPIQMPPPDAPVA
jgi:hypothetical protein